MSRWTAFPHPDPSYDRGPTALRRDWARLHRGDREPWPALPEVRAAWQACHAGDFGAAIERGIAAGPAGYNAACKAACIYATYLEPSETRRLSLYREAAARSERLQLVAPRDANAHYLYALAIGRWAQQVPLARALAEGLGARVRACLETALHLQPRHADAHVALGVFHAELVDKLGETLAGVSYGASREAAMAHFERALALNPGSAIARIEQANALAMLQGRKAMPRARRLYREAAACEAIDAIERLDAEFARAELGDA
jgi:tetratricopeptide (TPR) repeat protein